MKEYKVEHIFCGQIAHIKGFDIWHALKRNGLNFKYWKEI